MCDISRAGGPLVYIAGPFRGETSYNVRHNVWAAQSLGIRVARKGGIPIIPHSMYCDYDGEISDQFWLDATVHILSRCDAVLFGVGWQRSHGCSDELREAERIGIPRFSACEVSDGVGDYMDFNIWLRDWLGAVKSEG